MELVISARVQGILESYNIFVDDEKVAKVRGTKTTTLSLDAGKHTVRLKGGSGKSSIVKIEGSDGDIIRLDFITHYSRAFKEGYFEVVED